MKNIIFAIFLSAFALVVQADDSKPVQVLLNTDLGDIKLELYPDKAPKTVANFRNYVEAKHYDGLIFHRVIKGFMVQAGGFNEYMSPREPSGKPIRNESYNGLKNVRGSVAMARRGDPDSAMAQFFINSVNNAFLDRNGQNAGYAVFGKVIEGMEVVDEISNVPTGQVGPFGDVPRKPIHIISARILGEE
ncbi:MAG: peptidyl-prolyl cis-trans isomerase [Gammaproteobacteria bacterium]|nr:MAG: peptidyl-prolyl cis-trans isomerase [Gammaproteobacteria bacterium]